MSGDEPGVVNNRDHPLDDPVQNPALPEEDEDGDGRVAFSFSLMRLSGPGTVARIELSDIDVPGSMPQQFQPAFERTVDTLVARMGFRPNALLDRLCAFYATHGTSDKLDRNLAFIVPGQHGNTIVTHRDIMGHLATIGDGKLTIRNLMRCLADRTRDVIIAKPSILPIFVRLFLFPYHEFGFDYADACFNPRPERHVLQALMQCKFRGLGETPIEFAPVLGANV